MISGEVKLNRNIAMLFAMPILNPLEMMDRLLTRIKYLYVLCLPGSRGLLREIWKSTVKSNLLDIASLTSDAADHHVEFWKESSSPDVDTFQKTSGYSSKITGFFVPLHSDNYTFYIRSDDISELYLSTGAPADKVRLKRVVLTGAVSRQCS